RVRNLVPRLVARWMYRKAEEDAASRASGDDENAARRRLGTEIAREANLWRGTLGGEDHDAAVAFFPLGFAAKSCLGDRVVDDLPFKRVHRLKLHRFARGAHLGDDLLG